MALFAKWIIAAALIIGGLGYIALVILANGASDSGPDSPAIGKAIAIGVGMIAVGVAFAVF